MTVTLERRAVAHNITALQYLVILPTVKLHVAIAHGPAPQSGNKAIWSLSISCDANFDLPEAIVEAVKRRLLPHVPTVLKTVGFTQCGRFICSLVEAESMPFAGN